MALKICNKCGYIVDIKYGQETVYCPICDDKKEEILHKLSIEDRNYIKEKFREKDAEIEKSKAYNKTIQKLDNMIEELTITLKYVYEVMFGKEIPFKQVKWRERKKSAQEPTSDLPSYSMSNSNSICNIFNYWNSKNIIQHKELSKEREDSIKNSLKKYSEEEIKTYIDRYNTVIKDQTYFFDYKWTLTEFLSRKDGISAFTDEGSKWVSYNQKKTVQKKSNQNFQQREIANDQKYESVYDNIDDVDLT